MSRNWIKEWKLSSKVSIFASLATWLTEWVTFVLQSGSVSVRQCQKVIKVSPKNWSEESFQHCDLKLILSPTPHAPPVYVSYIHLRYKYPIVFIDMTYLVYKLLCSWVFSLSVSSSLNIRLSVCHCVCLSQTINCWLAKSSKKNHWICEHAHI